MITNASWTASYDVRVQTKALTCQLLYYGSVRNSTGEDWKDVKLFLSTASPSTRAAPPPLRTLRVRFPVPVYRPYGNAMPSKYKKIHGNTSALKINSQFNLKCPRLFFPVWRKRRMKGPNSPSNRVWSLRRHPWPYCLPRLVRPNQKNLIFTALTNVTLLEQSPATPARRTLFCDRAR